MQAQSSKAYLDRTQTKIAVLVIKCRRFSCESLWSWALLAGMQAYFAHFAVRSIWTFKLTESWGESKNDSKGEIACPTSMFLWVAFFFFFFNAWSFNFLSISDHLIYLSAETAPVPRSYRAMAP